MSLEFVRNVLLWSAAVNYALLVWWFLVFSFSHEWVFRLHGRWFHLSEERFNAIHYTGMTFYKILIFVFNLVPGLVLWWLGRS